MISYWDTSAILPVLIEEDSSKLVTKLINNSDNIYSSYFALFEIQGVLKRKLNQKLLLVSEYEKIQDRWAGMQLLFNFIVMDDSVTRTGLRLQKLYGIKPYDSVHLGSATFLQAGQLPVSFISLDQQLNRYAKQEGFTVPL